MRSIIHDWPDEKAAEILKNTISALGPDSVILIDDRVLPNVGVHWYATVIDMTMMAGLASQERTVEQWSTLMQKAGLKIQNQYTYTSNYNSIMECVLVS
jgi:demethylsterigmatocystin 6-O-methyltransferase